jgi:hypothetical protein
MLDESFFGRLGQRLLAESGPDGVMLLDRDFRIRGVNSVYEAHALRSRDDLIGEHVFDAFPDSPDDPDASGTSRLQTSVETVLRRRGTDTMPIVRYDLADPSSPDTFLPRLWTCDNTSVGDSPQTALGVIHRVKPIDTLEGALSALSNSDFDATEQLHILWALAAAVTAEDDWQSMKRDNEHLRRALENRDIIGQAKGIIMERYNVDESRAFDLLVTLSQESNLRVEKVAQKLVDVDHPSP